MLNWQVESAMYDIVELKQYALAQKSLPIHKALEHFDIAADTNGLARYI